MWWVVLVAVLQQVSGLHWQARCLVPIDPSEGPPQAIEFMLEPNDDWVSRLHDEGVPDAVVDSVLNHLIQTSAGQHGVMCRRLERRYDPEAVERSKSWPVQQYEPQIGWFRWRSLGPQLNTSRL